MKRLKQSSTLKSSYLDILKYEHNFLLWLNSRRRRRIISITSIISDGK